MGSVSQEELETMLKVYREKLAKAETVPIDYALCMRLSAQINLLEDLWFLARQNAAQQSVQRTPDKCSGTTGHDFQDGACVDCGFPQSMSGRR